MDIEGHIRHHTGGLRPYPTPASTCHTAQEKSHLDNGCGTGGLQGFLIADQLPGIFDFTASCCNHDYCWSSSLTRWDCDAGFYRDNIAGAVPYYRCDLHIPSTTPRDMRHTTTSSVVLVLVLTKECSGCACCELRCVLPGLLCSQARRRCWQRMRATESHSPRMQHAICSTRPQRTG